MHTAGVVVHFNLLQTFFLIVRDYLCSDAQVHGQVAEHVRSCRESEFRLNAPVCDFGYRFVPLWVGPDGCLALAGLER
uniref:Uncharacterized protein n=1 Tax=Arundo donax TaxID=35708 RepID=A0A0A9IB91_ARUDO